MKRIRLKSTLVRYAASYIAVALISCAALGVALMSISMRELGETTRAEHRNRLTLAAEYLGDQIKLMEGMRYEIQITPCYKPSYFTQHKYNEVLLLEDFVHFRNYTPLTQDYFLLYRGSKNVFKSASTNTFATYMQSVHRVSDTQSVYAALQSVTTTRIIIPQDDPSLMLFALPVFITGRDSPSGDATLCFAVRDDALRELLQSAIGQFPGALTMYYRDEIFFSDGALSEDAIVISAQAGNFTLSEALSQRMVNQRFNRYLYISALLICGIALGMLFIAVYLSYRNYRPIRALASQSKRYCADDDSDELTRISGALGMAYAENERAARQLDEEVSKLEASKRLVRAQLVQLLLAGRSQGANIERTLGIDIQDPYFSVVAVDEGGLSQDDQERLMNLLENLSDKTLMFFSVRLKEKGQFAVLVVLDGVERMGEAAELMEAVLEEASEGARLGAGFVTSDIERIPGSLVDALHALNRDNVECKMGNVLRYSENSLPQIASEIESGNTDQALALLSSFAEHVQRNALPPALLRCAFSELVNLMLRVIDGNKLPVSQELVGKCVLAADAAGFRSELAPLIAAMCEGMRDRLEQIEKSASDDVIQYIDQHACEYDLSLVLLAEVFGISEKQLSRVVRKATGMQYREYVTSLRVAKACDLLVEGGKSVSDISAAVGFMNVSYFIRIFKSVTDSTPGNYRKWHAGSKQ